MEDTANTINTLGQIRQWPDKLLHCALEVAEQAGSPLLLGPCGLAPEISVEKFVEDVRAELDRRSCDSA